SLLSAILSFQFMNKGWLSFGFLRVDDSYWKGLCFLFAMSSVLLSFKNFFKSILLLFLTGRAYNFSFVFNGLAAYFRVRSDSLFLVNNKLYLLLFHMAVVSCYFPLIAGVYFFFPNLPYLNEALSLGFFLFLFDLNPFQDSEISFLLKATINDDATTKLSSYLRSKSLISLMHPFERGRDTPIYFLLTKIAVLWSGVVLFSIYVAVGFHFEGFLQTMRSGELIDRVAALGSSSYLV